MHSWDCCDEMAYMENGLQVIQSNLSFSCENGYQYVKYYYYIKNATCIENKLSSSTQWISFWKPLTDLIKWLHAYVPKVVLKKKENSKKTKAK